jgi:hypothetical protein
VTADSITRDQLLATITTQYLSGEEFNGLPVRAVDLPRSELNALLRELVQAEAISLNFATYHPNPHIKAFPPEPVSAQLEKLEALDDITHLTAYPESAHLEQVVNSDDYAGRPFTLALALGCGELMPKFFELSVLEFYRNDPRYFYETDDTSGRISVTNEFYESEHLQESDRVFLETFGFGYNEDFQRAVCAFPRYLGRLTPEHQQIWAAKELGEGYFMHPAYRASALLGQFPDKVSIFQAFTEELNQLQKMSEVAELPPLVRRSFTEAEKPSNFGFLIRPTLKELQDFHATLDKMMSENLNHAFFKEFRISLEREIPRPDGKIEVQRKGSIALLQEWMDRFRTDDRSGIVKMIETFKEVRKLRQRPAHAADDNRFDIGFYEQQRELVQRAYEAVRMLRLVFTNHPALVDYEGVPGWLYQGEIYNY